MPLGSPPAACSAARSRRAAPAAVRRLGHGRLCPGGAEAGRRADRFRVIGESAAGPAFPARSAPEQAVRIFTGAPVPDGADRVVLQEDVTRDGDDRHPRPRDRPGTNIRPPAPISAGRQLDAPRRLSPADVALIAAMNHAAVPVTRRPEVAILATGDELVPPGTTRARTRSSPPTAMAFTRCCGRRRPAADAADRRDNLESLALAFRLAEGADLILTIGGASVGDHDLVGAAAEAEGLERTFWKVAMRPGKPLMAGRMAGSMMIGLPGNPVSAMVCGTIFVLPVIGAMLGLPAAPAPRETPARWPPPSPPTARASTTCAARRTEGAQAFDRQDSSLLRLLPRRTA